ncbi:hypothetical protein EYF80_053573 [Liparis tanakae]|uniref:Uncharacterized protein n=1 Tax=Liparis tanakae TaxID=230148 RepID=A0A4Z2F4V8_9TELE|nr:hypothetical protein EYF80_053573 [Liparis tanakae]
MGNLSPCHVAPEGSRGKRVITTLSMRLLHNSVNSSTREVPMGRAASAALCGARGAENTQRAERRAERCQLRPPPLHRGLGGVAPPPGDGQQAVNGSMTQALSLYTPETFPNFSNFLHESSLDFLSDPSRCAGGPEIRYPITGESPRSRSSERDLSAGGERTKDRVPPLALPGKSVM